MKNWLNKNLSLLIIFLGFVVLTISAQKLMLEKAELKSQLIEQQEHYELTIEVAYDTVNIIKSELELQKLLLEQQELHAELLEDYNKVLEERLTQAKEAAKGIYTEEDIHYIIDIFATYLVEYPPSGTICVYENGTLFVFKTVNNELILDEILSYNDLKELWLNK